MNIGDRIEVLLKKSKMTKQELCDRTKVGRATLFRIMYRENNPTLRTLERIADGLGVPVQDLINKD